jgi:hypothetical protein
VIDHALPRAMQRLNVLLLDGLLRDERNVPLTRGCADASASLPSFFCRRTNGFTYCGLMIFTQWPSASNLRAQ